MTWLHVVGIGDDGLDGLAPSARRVVQEAEYIFGGARHLAMMGTTSAECVAWPSPFNALLETIDKYREHRVCVLASGDPTCFGIASRLLRRFGSEDMRVWPAPSAFSLARARMLWTFGDITELTLHGRPLAELQRHIYPDERLLILSWDEWTPASIAKLLVERGYGDSRMTVLERLGGQQERIRLTRARSFDLEKVQSLNIVAVECIQVDGAECRSLSAGLPDALYEHDGQLTKRIVRAATLSALMPQPGQVLWDIGAGSGSVSIEWMLSGPRLTAFAVERELARLEMIERNAETFGVPKLKRVHGEAPGALADLPPPDAIFVGGNVSDATMLDECMSRLIPGGRLVANAVTLQAENRLQAMCLDHGGELNRIQVSEARAMGRFDVMQPAKAVLQWMWCKPA